MSDLIKEIGKRIKHYRKAKRMTQKELAEAIGVAEITVRQYESGRFEPKIDTRIAICEALDATYDCLFNPTVAAEPKKGRWILDRSGAYCCSECMEPCAGYVMMKPRDKFCKMCGAKMEGEQHGRIN